MKGGEIPESLEEKQTRNPKNFLSIKKERL